MLFIGRASSHAQRLQKLCGEQDLPTLTAVRLSSSEALLPPKPALPPTVLLPDMLKRLLLRGSFGRAIALAGLCMPDAGEPGGEVAIMSKAT